MEHIKQLVDLLNEDLKNEYMHFHFYLHSSFMLTGMERLYLKTMLDSHASGELEHIKMFADKIRAFGVTPNSVANPFPTDLTNAKDILRHSLKIEEEVVDNYHKRHAQATSLYEKTGKYYDLIVFIEEQIEDSQRDIDELVKLLNTHVKFI